MRWRLSSGTAALHLALVLCGVGPGDEVLVSTLTFAASANPIVYLGAEPVFVDSEAASWNMDPQLLADALAERAQRGRLPKAVVLVHLYGQSADIDPILAACDRYGVALIEDAAEALGASYKGKMPGTLGKAGIYSFNGNKIITTSGGGMLVSEDGAFIEHARKLATQARDPAPHYQHSEIGYNYRMSNVLAGIGRGQLEVLGRAGRRAAAQLRLLSAPAGRSARSRLHARSTVGLSYALAHLHHHRPCCTSAPTGSRCVWRWKRRTSKPVRSGNPCICSRSSPGVK